MKKKVKIKFVLNNRMILKKYPIIICDDNRKILFNGTTTELGYLDFEFPSEGIYKIIVFPEQNTMPKKICIPVFFSFNCCKIWTLFLNNQIIHTPITITVTDQYYKDLPIEKGEITICQKLT